MINALINVDFAHYELAFFRKLWELSFWLHSFFSASSSAGFAALKPSATLLMQNLSPVGWGPSWKTWPRWAWHCVQKNYRSLSTKFRFMALGMLIPSCTSLQLAADLRLNCPVSCPLPLWLLLGHHRPEQFCRRMAIQFRNCILFQNFFKVHTH